MLDEVPDDEYVIYLHEIKQLKAQLAAVTRELNELVGAMQEAIEIIRDSYGQQDPDIESDCAAVRTLERAIAARIQSTQPTKETP